MKKILIVTGPILILIIGLVFFYNVTNLSNSNKQLKSTKVNVSPTTASKDIKIKITAVGDVLAHQDQLDSQYNQDTKDYDFNNNFTYVTPYIKSSDLSLVNLETTLGGTASGGYKGYPTFNSPDALATALQNAGFNEITAINNHSIDQGVSGLKRTISVLKGTRMDLLGLRSTEQDKRYSIKDVKGIKVGMISYGFETAPTKTNKTINSIPIPNDVQALMNTFNPDKPDHDIAQMKEQIALMKNDGAELIIFYMHWGDEYLRAANSYQTQMAEALSDAGVDIIFGSHPHVIEPITHIKSSVSGKDTLVVYSMGNFLSNQRYERTDNRYTEDGIIVNVVVKKDTATNKITIDNTTFIPTWINRIPNGKLFVYEILPLTDALKDKAAFKINDQDTEWRADNSMKVTTSLIQSTDSSIRLADSLSEQEKAVFKNK